MLGRPNWGRRNRVLVAHRNRRRFFRMGLIRRYHGIVPELATPVRRVSTCLSLFCGGVGCGRNDRDSGFGLVNLAENRLPLLILLFDRSG